MEKLLASIYYNPKSGAAFSGINCLYDQAKKRDNNLRRSDVKDWLERQYTYNLHKPVRRKFMRNKVFSRGINDQFQIDLADMQLISDDNDGYKYLFNCICVFSKYAWSVVVKNKTGKEMVRAFKIIIGDRKPNRVQSDDGMEFKNRLFQDLLNERGIQFFSSKNRKIKAAVVERFNRTLQDFVDGYNKTYHRSIRWHLHALIWIMSQL